jgi:hypothetical protein
MVKKVVALNYKGSRLRKSGRGRTLKSNQKVPSGLTFYIFAVFMIIVIIHIFEAQSLAALDNGFFPETLLSYLFKFETKTIISYMLERMLVPLPFVLASLIFLLKVRLNASAVCMSVALFVDLSSNLLAYALKYGTTQV